MRFTNVIALLAAATLALAEDSACNAQNVCDASKGLNGKTYTGDLKLVAVQDSKDSNIKYKVGGTIVVKNDCEFEVQNFYLDPAPRNAFWGCNRKGEVNGLKLMASGEYVSAVNPNAPTTLTYSVKDKVPFCEASLLNDCADYSLLDEDWQLIAKATNVNPDATGSNNSGSSGNGNKSSSSGGSKSNTSDATTSKWSMALLGLSSIAAYLLA